MKTHDVTHLDTQIKDMCHSLANLADEKDFEEFRLLIRKPGWTTVAELSLVTGVVDSMHSQLKTLTGLKQVLLIGSRAVRSEVNLPSPEEIDAMSHEIFTRVFDRIDLELATKFGSNFSALNSATCANAPVKLAAPIRKT